MAVLEELIINLGVDTSDADEGLGRFNKGLRGMAAGAGNAGAAVGAVFSEAVGSAMDISAARGQLQRDLGLTAEEAKSANEVMSSVFRSGLVASMDEAREATSAVILGLDDMKGAGTEDIAAVSEQALVLSKTLGVDVGEAARAAGALVTNGLVKTSKEGLDLLTASAPMFPAAMREELPELLADYGDGFAKIGLDGATAMGLLSQAVKGGAKDLDEAGDILNEFGRIATEEPDRAKEAFKALKIPVKDTLKAIQSGGPEGQKALGTITQALRGLKDPAQQAALVTQIFGDRAGDSVQAVLALNPATATAAGNLKDFAGASKEATDAAKDEPMVQMQQTMNTLKDTLGEALLPVLEDFGKFLSENQDTIQSLVVPGLIALVGVFVLLTIATIAWGVAILLTPIGWIAAGIILLIAIIALIVIKWDEIKAKTIEVWDSIKSALSSAWDWVTQKVSQVWNWLTDKIGGAWESVKTSTMNVWESIRSALSSAWNWVTSTVSSVWTSVTSFISNAWNTIKTWVSNGVNAVISIINKIAAVPGKVRKWFGDMIRRAGELKSGISNKLSGLWSGITSGLRGLLNSAIGLINRAIGGLNSMISMANKIPGVSIPSIPRIPFLEHGGVVMGPTLAVVGEGAEPEVVMPLSRLETMLSVTQPAPSTMKVEPITVRTVIEVRGGNDAFTAFFKKVVRDVAGGDVIQYARSR